MSEPSELDFWKDFIEIYKNNPQLWKKYKAQFKDKSKRRKGYEQLLTKMREIDPNATLETVKKKVISFRAAYNREIRKIKESKIMVDDPSDVYVSPWCFFENFSFLANIDKKDDFHSEDDYRNEECAYDTSTNLKQRRRVKERKCKSVESSIGLTFQEEVSEDVDPFDMIHEDILVDNKDIKVEDLNSNLGENDDDLVKEQDLNQKNLHSFGLANPLLEQQTPEYRQLFRFICKQLQSSNTEPEVNGRIWSTQYRRLTSDQQLFAKKAIDDVLFEARLGNLRSDSLQINDNSCLKCGHSKNADGKIGNATLEDQVFNNFL